MKGLMKVPEAGEVYLHHKGLAYEVLCLAKDQDREELLVIHQGSDGQIWSRTVGNFMAYTSSGVPRFLPNQSTDASSAPVDEFDDDLPF